MDDDGRLAHDDDDEMMEAVSLIRHEKTINLRPTPFTHEET